MNDIKIIQDGKEVSLQDLTIAPSDNICRKCGGKAEVSKAYGDAYSCSEESGSKTIFPGAGSLIDCLKCSFCGHSWVPPSTTIKETLVTDH